MKYFEELMKSSNCSNGSGHSCTKKEKPSRNGEMRNKKPKDKPTFYQCGNIGHTKNICRRKMVCKTLNLSLLVIIFIARNNDIKYMSVGQDYGMHLLHLDLKGIITTVKNMGIEHLSIDQRQNPTG